MDIIVGNGYKTNKNGDLVVIKYFRCDKVMVRFVDTGYERYTDVKSIRAGTVKDKMRPSIFGVGFIGDGTCLDSSGKQDRAYQIWIGMLSRCYNKSLKEYKYYGGNGVEVCYEWHNFQNFKLWYYQNINHKLDQIDKDIFSDGNKRYSPETCVMISKSENVAERNRKQYKFMSPSREVITVGNLNKFCLANRLNPDCMRQVYRGIIHQHNGWVSVNDRDEPNHKVYRYKVLSPNGDKFDFYDVKQFCLDNHLIRNSFMKMLSGSRASYKKWTLIEKY